MDIRKFELNKKQTLGGNEYPPGFPCSAIEGFKDMPDHKISQFLNQRIIRPMPSAE